MTILQKTAALTLALGMVSLLAIALGHLALTDIGHAEGDLTAEWRVLQLAGAAILLFHLFGLLTAALALRRPRTGGPAGGRKRR